MDNSTELAQRMKAAAIRAKAATDDYVSHRISITTCISECEEFNNLTDGPDNTIALVEALEAAEKRIAEHNLENRLLANADRDIKALRQRIAELEARTVTLPQYRNSPDMHTKQFYEAIGFNQGLDIFIEALRAAGIQVIEGEG